MNGESLRYECALAAGRSIYGQFLPEPDKPDALIFGQIVFIVIEAMVELERRQGQMGMPRNRMNLEDGGEPEEQRPEEWRFFCPKCFQGFKVNAASEHRQCRCPICGAWMRTPDTKARN
jgi:hypothetical protein